jgi:hypothetical protein
VEIEHLDDQPRSGDVHHLAFFEPYEVEQSHILMKIRPGTMEVLHSLSDRFNLHLCTMGTKAYVTEALKVLDPDRSLFKHLICREDLPTHPNDPSALVKDLYRIKCIQDPTWAVVLDDSPGMLSH